MTERRASYALVAAAIGRWREDPELAIQAIALQLKAGTHALDRAFRACAGLSPKQFQQVIAVERSRLSLRRGPILAAALESGMSGPGRMHDRWIRVEALTPGQARAQGAGAEVRWGRAPSALGEVSIAWTARGIHRCGFGGMERAELLMHCPSATLIRDDQGARALAAQAFAACPPAPLRVRLIGTPFQIAVWRALLTIPAGSTATYAAIARAIGRPRAHRAVGSACGDNPVALLIPCHRAIQASGALGGFRWDPARKACLLAAEAAAAGAANAAAQAG
jgi:AraC family transcriptional regulator of adaptative response/methylated-DNA-[protein]-cysteine methyltransferase